MSSLPVFTARLGSRGILGKTHGEREEVENKEEMKEDLKDIPSTSNANSLMRVSYDQYEVGDDEKDDDVPAKEQRSMRLSI